MKIEFLLLIQCNPVLSSVLLKLAEILLNSFEIGKRTRNINDSSCTRGRVQFSSNQMLQNDISQQ